MRYLVALALVLSGCGPATPEEFVDPYVEGYCTAAVECWDLTPQDFEECMETNTGEFGAQCTSVNVPDWDPARAATCLEYVEDFACGGPNQANSLCANICAAGS